MQMIEVGSAANGEPVRLAYQDAGSGRPVVLIHGWPASHAMWQYQSAELPKHGIRAIAYDRRGFGHSSKPWEGYDYDTLADDLKGVLDGLDLQDVTLVGFSMGGGEVARYMARHGGARVAKVVFVAAVTPYLLKTADNPEGVDAGIFQQMLEGLNKDWPDFLATFGKQFFNVGMLKQPVSQATLDWMQHLALQASLKATLDCVHSFAETDFRNDLSGLAVPALIIHGDADQIVPMEASANRTVELLRSVQYKVYEGGSHGLFLTHKDELNRDLVQFVTAK
ncbi:alpha/beta hydrolase [Noviherbaspirillum sp. CPCC 100848]|uniref:Alpha/beta hydrolase n=1 Tax=Noviherbaspirillum album TaxID=3080276 RepID=A0ABU6J3H8_9BURK|nr:alpha/beta hydrolase [Noviherbaspirillum sp. CPCC 100848]MEC4717981.1 alpha/beta hydrolase [Noviherbaspirillum sp. CPCC 100848]